MPDEILVRHCSPTLAGLKTGNLFGVEFSCKEEMQHDIRDLNKKLLNKGLRIIPLRFEGKRALLYLYRPANLEIDLSRKEASKILSEMGYLCSSSEQCIVKLISRLKDLTDFPHEIGLFLGYPPEDVRGFIENKAANFKCIGTWKVYGDVQKAQKTFSAYRKCTQIYFKELEKGRSIEQLAVAV